MQEMQTVVILRILDLPNPLFDAVLRGFGTQLELAIAQQPTLITLWIGNNDILAFATRGGSFLSDHQMFNNFLIIIKPF